MYLRRLIDRIFYAKREREEKFQIASIIAKVFELASIETDPQKKLCRSRAFTFLDGNFKLDVVPTFEAHSPLGLEETFTISIADRLGFPLFECRVKPFDDPQVLVYHRSNWEPQFLMLKRAG